MLSKSLHTRASNRGSEISDPNIPGPGVVFAFIITGLLTVISSFESLRRQLIAQQKKAQQLQHKHATRHDTFSPGFWAQVLEDFLIQLSDQQLLLGLVVLICAFVSYYRTALGGNDNLWHAADVACFSMFSHAATVLALRKYLRESKKLAAVRVCLMLAVFALWGVIGYNIIHPKGPYHKPKPIVRFWHSATYIGFLAVSWAYMLTCVPIFISEEAIAGGKAISSNNNCQLKESLGAWEQRAMEASQKWYNPLILFRLLRFIIIRLLFYFQESLNWVTGVISIIFHFLFFSPVSTGVALFIFWLFTLSALILGFKTSFRRHELNWDFGQSLSIAMVVLPFQSFASAVASARSSRRLNHALEPFDLENGSERGVSLPPNVQVRPPK